MKVYFAGQGVSLSDTLKFRQDTYDDEYCFLYSYLEVKSTRPDYPLLVKNIKDPIKQIFLDSGAFSAFTQGVKINIDEYMRVIKESGVELYANLDVIGDYKATRHNQEYMESKGFRPLPTFHQGSPLSELERLCQNYEYIALGGLVSFSSRQNLLIVWLKKCFQIIMKYNTRVHGFGVGSFLLWKMFPFYSVDATTWLIGGKFRRIVKFDGNAIKTYGKNSLATLEFAKCHFLDYSLLNLHNTIEFHKAAKFVTRLWASRGIVFN